MVRGVDDRLVAQRCVAAGKDADDVRRLVAPDGVAHRERGGDAERHRPEVALACGRHEARPVLARERRQPLGRRLGDPALEPDPFVPRPREARVLAAPGGLHGLPRIAGGGIGVDHDRADRALPRRALVLVGPAAVVEAALAGKERGIPVRVVVQHQEDLAAQVGPLEVVPRELRRLDPEADEDHLRALDRHLRRIDRARGDEVLAIERQRARAGVEFPPLRRRAGDAEQLERLLPALVGAAGAEAEALHPRREVEPRETIGARAGPATLERVVGEEADRRGELVGADAGRRRGFDPLRRACRASERGRQGRRDQRAGDAPNRLTSARTTSIDCGPKHEA